MDFYKLIKQQYEYYKSKYGILPPTYENNPCKTIRHKLINKRDRKDCTGDIIDLANKYKIDDFEAYSCDGCALTAVENKKKIYRKKEINKI